MMSPKHKEKEKDKSRSWSYLHYILVALVLIGVLSFAISSRHHAQQMASGHLSASSDVSLVAGGKHGLQRGKAEPPMTLQAARGGGDSAAPLQDPVLAKSSDFSDESHTGDKSAAQQRTRGNLRSDKGKGSSSGSSSQNLASKSSTTHDASAVGAAGKAFANSTLHTVTYASHGGRDDRFCRAVESAIREGHDLVILGWGEAWKGLSQKLSAAYEYALSLPPQDMLLFTDAFDVLFQGGPQHIHSTFKDMDTEILFSAECGCWPHIMEKKGRPCFDAYPKSPTPYRYLNSGTWIGRAAQSARMLQAVIDSAGGDFVNANDQKLVADFYIQGKYGLKLDFYNKVFQSMHMTLDAPLPFCNPMADMQLKGGRFYNKLTKSVPSVLHFNGGGKRYHLSMERSIWYKTPALNTREEKSKLQSFMVSTPTKEHPRKRVRFDHLCPGYVK